MVQDDHEAISEIINGYQKLSDEIDTSRMDQKQRIFEREMQWLNNIATTSFGIGGVIIPLILINKEELADGVWTLGVASLLLITNGLIIVLKTKQGIENDGRLVASMGYLYQAIMVERTALLEGLRKDTISRDSFSEGWSNGVDELNAAKKELNKGDSTVSYWPDIHAGALLIGVLMIPYAFFRPVFWPLIILVTIAIALFFVKSATKSGKEVKETNKKIQAYKERISN